MIAQGAWEGMGVNPWPLILIAAILIIAFIITLVKLFSNRP